MTVLSEFDLEALHRGHSDHDAEALVELYTDDAVIEVVDAVSPPSNPRVLKGREALREYFEDVCSRDMTHQVQDPIVAGDHLAFRVACQYATGERVLTSETCRLRDGKIAHETLVQAWDS